MSADTSPLVAVINTSEQLIALLRLALESEGYRTVTAFTHELKSRDIDLAAFLQEHDARVIVYDIAVPYEENWDFFQELLRMPSVASRQFVLTTTNKRALDELVGPTRTLEIIGKPFDLAQFLDAVRGALRA